MDEKMEKAWIAATSACVEVIDGEHQYVAPVSPEQWERALNAAFDAARLREPAGVGVVAAQLRRELAEDKGWDYTEYEKGRIAEKERCIAILEAAPQPPAEALFMADSVHNQAPPGTREGHMVVLETDAVGKPTIWCDPEIVDLVRALNEGGLRTIASCSGHGEKPFGIVTLRDGRELLVLPDYETTRKAERILSEALIPAEAQVQGGGDSTRLDWLASEARMLSGWRDSGRWEMPAIQIDSTREHCTPADLRAAIDQERGKGGGGVIWHPIESAPKDGRTIRFRNTDSGLTDIGYWESWEGMDADQRARLPEWAKDWDGEWCTDEGNGDMTHWAHLSAADSLAEYAELHGWEIAPERLEAFRAYCDGSGHD